MFIIQAQSGVKFLSIQFDNLLKKYTNFFEGLDNVLKKRDFYNNFPCYLLWKTRKSVKLAGLTIKVR